MNPYLYFRSIQFNIFDIIILFSVNKREPGPQDEKFNVKTYFPKDWLNTETAKKPPTIVIIRKNVSEPFILDVAYADFSGVRDVPNEYSQSKCYVIPSYKPLAYISLYPRNSNVDIYAIRSEYILIS